MWQITDVSACNIIIVLFQTHLPGDSLKVKLKVWNSRRAFVIVWSGTSGPTDVQEVKQYNLWFSYNEPDASSAVT